MRTTETWMPQAGVEEPTLSDLRWEVERLREELSRVRSELARERAARSAPRPVTTDFGLEAMPFAAPPRSTEAEAWGRRAPDPRAGATPEPGARDREPRPAPFDARPVGATFVMPRDQGLDFGAIKQLSPEELDALPYGLITLDAEGRILHYNDTESRMVGLPKHAVLGRKFFGEIAPCARVREFEGRFLELVRDPYRVRVQTFDFVFRFANGTQEVTIVITPARERGQYHMALLRRAAPVGP